MDSILTILHVFVCLLLVTTILLQPGKSPGMGGAFGGGAGAGNFGAKSPTTILSKITVVLAVSFMASSMTLAWMAVRDHAVIDFSIDDAHQPAQGLAVPEEAPAPPEGFEVPAEPAAPASGWDEGGAGEAAPPTDIDVSGDADTEW